MIKSKEEIYEAVVAAVRDEEPYRSKEKDITMSTNLKYEFEWDSLAFGLAISRCEDELKASGAEFDIHGFARVDADKVETVGDIVDAIYGFQKQYTTPMKESAYTEDDVLFVKAKIDEIVDRTLPSGKTENIHSN